MKVTLTEPEIAGSYLVAERREDGTPVLEPERELLSEAIAETDDLVFQDEEFIAHLARVAAAQDDLPPDDAEQACRHSSELREFRRLSRGCPPRSARAIIDDLVEVRAAA